MKTSWSHTMLARWPQQRLVHVIKLVQSHSFILTEFLCSDATHNPENNAPLTKSVISVLLSWAGFGERSWDTTASFCGSTTHTPKKKKKIILHSRETTWSEFVYVATTPSSKKYFFNYHCIHFPSTPFKVRCFCNFERQFQNFYFEFESKFIDKKRIFSIQLYISFF